MRALKLPRGRLAQACSGLTLFALGACVAEIDPTDASRSQQTVAELSVGPSQVRFERLDHGGVAVIAQRGQGPSVFDDPAVRELNFVEQYEYWAGAPAPAELVALLEAERSDRDTDDGDPKGPAITTAALTADEFENEFCSGSGDRVECFTDQTGNAAYSSRARTLRGYVGSAHGQVEFELRLDRAVGGWQSRGRWSVNEGEVWDYNLSWNGLARRPLEVRINQAAGDRYHLFAEWFIDNTIK